MYYKGGEGIFPTNLNWNENMASEIIVVGAPMFHTRQNYDLLKIPASGLFLTEILL